MRRSTGLRDDYGDQRPSELKKWAKEEIADALVWLWITKREDAVHPLDPYTEAETLRAQINRIRKMLGFDPISRTGDPRSSLFSSRGFWE